MTQRTGRRGRRIAIVTVAALLALLGAGLFTDVRNFDRTSGGYEPPYEGWTGEPIDWSAAERTERGLVGAGYVLRTRLDCTDGMISFGNLGLWINFRPVSERAIVVHQPREACLDAGFSPEF